MKKGWEQIPMGQLCSISSGASDTQDAVEDGAYAFFDRSRTVKKSSRFLYDCEALIIPGEGKEFLPRHFVGKFDLHQRAYALFDFTNQIDPRFLYFYLHHFSHYLPNVAVGATVKSLRRRHFEQLPVAVTTLAEQQRIVGMLDEAFAGLATAQANAEKNLQNARALFESRVNAVFTQRGEDWVNTTLGAICENLDSKRVPITKSRRVAGDHPYYGASGIVDYVSDYIFDEDLLLVSEDGANLLARTYPIAFSVSGKTWVNNHAHVLRFADFAMQRLIEYYLNSITLDSYISGMAQPKLNQKALNSIPVPLPPKPHQQAIVDTLDSLQQETHRLASIYERKLAALDALKSSLLHQAFTGQL